jgi:hypothetical protein
MSCQKQCIFCGQPGGNEEHIVGKWLLRDLDLYSTRTRLGFGSQLKTGAMDEIDESRPLGGFVTDAVCTLCNNGWMSQLESSVKPLISPLLVDPWPSNDRPLLSALFLKCHIITRWLLKTACTFGEKMSVQVPDYIRNDLYSGRLNPEIMADISCNDQCGFYVGMSRTWNCFADGSLGPMKVPDHSFRFVWQLRHLAMRVAYFPGCEKMMTKPRYPVRLYPRFGIPPSYYVGTAAKPGYRYSTLEELEHDTVYATAGSPIQASNLPPSSLVPP